MKQNKMLTRILVLVMAMTLLASVSIADDAATTDDGEMLIGGEVVSPMTSFETFEELQAAMPDVKLLAAPEDALDVSYNTIAGEPLLAQIEFSWDDDLYTLRAAAASAKNIEMAGVYVDFDDDDAAEELIDVAFAPAIKDFALSTDHDDGQTLASWYNQDSKTAFTLYSETAGAPELRILFLLGVLEGLFA